MSVFIICSFYNIIDKIRAEMFNALALKEAFNVTLIKEGILLFVREILHNTYCEVSRTCFLIQQKEDL
jgi:hypothetical protein